MSGHRVVRVHLEDTNVVGIAGPPGRKLLHVAIVDQPVRLITLPLEDEKYVTTLATPTVKSAARRMLAYGRRVGINEGARELLKEAQK